MSSYKLTNQQSEQLIKCEADFKYFCETYVVIKSWNIKEKQYLQARFKLFPFQEELFQHWENNRFSINSKFRQGGFTTLAVIYGLWLCLFKIDQKVIVLAKTDRCATDDCGLVCDAALSHLPEWLKGLSMKNDHQKKFDTGSIMYFNTPEATIGKAMNLLIIDEAASIKDIDNYWKTIYPVLSTGGRCIVQSTPNNEDDWFWERLIDARVQVGAFREYRCHYTDRPEFADPAWEIDMKRNLGQNGWDREVEQIPSSNVQIVEVKPKSAGRWRCLKDDWTPSQKSAGSLD